ncbi:DUF4435 domain-containing protein [Thioflexithrix psekupsensis]|uniref:DUF4435 domain-containing protein n=1 Tax=Thioflexithrix psekupsensis TaxID=1570016 RepID=A0A251X761_9GAMM|nr:DUF4435 domain-containing protein [Thioflexithrix psekupsensis]OUD13770.1 hypothetical protein TPSD3_05305 [Thioflexithrix psekupsensis]
MIRLADFQEKRNELSPTRSKILVFVESYADVRFWYGILEPYQKQAQIRFDISPHSGDNLTTGKDSLIKLFSNTGKNYLICLDSDYDYILQSECGKEIAQNPYIFQTYAYAIENLKCYAESLNSLCVKATNSTKQLVDLCDFLTEYSKIIYPLLVLNLYCKHIGKSADFSIGEFGKIVTFGDIIPNKYEINHGNYKEKLKIIQESVSQKIQTFNHNNLFPDDEFLKGLSELGLNETNAYLFMKGHHLYKFIEKFLVNISKELEAKEKSEIEELANNSIKPEEEKTSKIGEYFNSRVSITELLKVNDKFTDCDLFKKIEEDIRKYLTLKQIF